MQVWGRRMSSTVESKLSPEELARITRLVKQFNLSNTTNPAESHIPDVMANRFTLELGGHLYYGGPEEKELATELQSILTEEAKAAVNEKWAKTGPFRLGRLWQVKEDIRDSKGRFHRDYWLGTWTRRGDMNLFDAVWHNFKTGEEMKDVVQFDSAERGTVRLHRQRTKQAYEGDYRAEEMNTIFAGTVRGPGFPVCSWWATVHE
jgi:hypothetical protein